VRRNDDAMKKNADNPLNYFLAEDCRMNSSEAITRVSFCSAAFFLSRCLNKIVAAVSPILNAGCVMVVNGGLSISDV
jgi:hypothetical protein